MNPQPNPLPEKVLDELSRRWPALFANPARYRLQILTTIGDVQYGFRVDAEYFYPASSIKTCAALAALTLFDFDAVADDVRRLCIVSDNPAYNRLYDLVGPERLNAIMHEAGLWSVRLTHHLGVESAIYHHLTPQPETPDLHLGTAHIVQGTRIESPLPFANRNRISLADLHALIRMIDQECGFDLSPQAWQLLHDSMTVTPRQSGIAEYASLPDDHVKFFLPGVERALGKGHAVILNKCGRAFGFTIDNAVIRTPNQATITLTAALYTNANSVLNDDVYEYDTIASPFMADLAELVLTSSHP